MNMLHTRRKAETEVLSSLPSRMLTTDDSVSMEMEDDKSIQGSKQQILGVNPLARYLIIKINDALRSLSGLNMEAALSSDIFNSSDDLL